MKNFNLPLLMLVVLIISGCSQDAIELDENIDASLITTSSQEILTIDQINAIISRQLDANKSFNWDDTTDQVIYSATVHGANVLTIGYGQKGESFSETGTSRRLASTKDNILNAIQISEGKTRKQVLFDDDEFLNVIDVQVESIETIAALRERGDIRYLEPNGYSFYTNVSYPQNRSSSGCDTDGETLNSADYRTIAPGSRVSWTFDEHNITQAWQYSTGANVTVAVVDTGLSPNQSLLNSSGINDGYSNGRTVQKYGTFIDSNWWWSNNIDGPNDQCGHGTSMAATIASPRNNNNLPVGVAYNSNLVTYRATEDVVLNDYHERKGVKNALVALGNRSDVKIISMSIGYPWSIGNVRDGVRYAHSKGKLIFAAGGTSLNFTNWYPVIFPASMSETVAVTGITDNGNYQQCDVCHDGSQIEFTVVMERDNDNSRTSAVLGFNNGDNDYVGGSSVATATTAGIAALVWSKYPNWSRDQVLNKMRQSAEFYPNKSSTKGYGNIDALQAVQ